MHLSIGGVKDNIQCLHLTHFFIMSNNNLIFFFYNKKGYACMHRYILNLQTAHQTRNLRWFSPSGMTHDNRHFYAKHILCNKCLLAFSSIEAKEPFIIVYLFLVSFPCILCTFLPYSIQSRLKLSARYFLLYLFT